MGKELIGHGAFRDKNDAEWDVGVYQITENGKSRYDTVVRSPEGEYFRPEEDFLGDFKLIDKQGNEHRDALPMDMDEFQVAVERVEDAAWGRRSPAEMKKDGNLTLTERDSWNDIMANFDDEAVHPRETAPAPKAEKAPSWRDKIREQVDKVRGSSQGIG